MSEQDPPPPLARGGWLDRGTIGEFRKYAGYLAWKLGDDVNRWITLNEPMVVAVNGYVNIPGIVEGNFPPGAWNYTGVIDAIVNMADANASAYKAVKRRDPARASASSTTWSRSRPTTQARARDQHATAHAEYLFNRLFMDAAVLGIRDRDADGIVDPGERSRATGEQGRLRRAQLLLPRAASATSARR